MGSDWWKYREKLPHFPAVGSNLPTSQLHAFRGKLSCNDPRVCCGASRLRAGDSLERKVHRLVNITNAYAWPKPSRASRPPTAMAQRRQLDTFDWFCQLLPEESLILLLDSVLVRTRCGGATSSNFPFPTTQFKPLTPPLALVLPLQTTFPNATEVYPTWAGAGRRRGVAGSTNRFSGGLIGNATRCSYCQHNFAITLVPGRHQARH